MEGRWQLTAAVVDGDRGWQRSASSGAGSPTIGEGGEDVGRMRWSEGFVGVISAAVEGDGGEWHELDRAPGELQLRRPAVMFKAVAPAVPGRR